MQNEFDCVLTKGFRSLLVECKARRDINQEFYYKIASLAREYGINAKPVLIADTEEREDRQNGENEKQRRRGEMLHVKTFYKMSDLDNIGRKLADYLKDGK